MTLVAWVAVAIFVGVYVLVATERIHRVAAALGGAALVLGLGIVGVGGGVLLPRRPASTGMSSSCCSG